MTGPQGPAGSGLNDIRVRFGRAGIPAGDQGLVVTKWARCAADETAISTGCNIGTSTQGWALVTQQTNPGKGVAACKYECMLETEYDDKGGYKYGGCPAAPKARASVVCIK